MTYKYWETDELQHSGVKGMKWGVRRAKKASKMLSRYRQKTNNQNASYEDVANYHANKYKKTAIAAVLTTIGGSTMGAASTYLHNISPAAGNVLAALGFGLGATGTGLMVSAKIHRRKNNLAAGAAMNEQ